jgi:transcriptional regulator with XRE-family HTH domain
MNHVLSSFGMRLRWWRERRGLSQLDLAGEADTSQRHVSFVESGRTKPSREMVLRLAAALDVPLRQQNALLLSAGYAPAWRESALDAPELAQINRALDHMLSQQEPFPAVVVDRRWNLLRANDGAGRMVAFLAGAPPAGPLNILEAIVAPDGLRPLIVNWEEVTLYLLRGLHADAMIDGAPETRALLDKLLAFPDVPRLWQMPKLDESQAPVLPLQLRKGNVELKLFTTIATLGTPQDATLQDIRVESFFPLDEVTATTFRRWAKEASGDTSTRRRAPQPVRPTAGQRVAAERRIAAGGRSAKN